MWKDLDNASRQVLIALYTAATLTVDDLPYTDEFDRLCDDFNRLTGKNLSRHDFWRAMSSARKTGHLQRKER